MPQHHPTTAAPALPPVPIAVLLPTARPRQRRVRAGGQPTDHGGLTIETARLITTYTQPGDLVIDLHASPATARAASWLDRRTTPTLTHRHRPGEPEGEALRPRLVLTRLPHDRHAGLDLHALTEWMRHIRAVLRPGGHLIATVAADDPAGRYIDHATTVITAARTAGLIYHQHLITVHTPLPEHEPATAETPHTSSPHLPQGRHLRVHSDLYVFATIPGDVDA